MAKIDLLHLTLCSPSDVQREIDIAREVITAWNTQHGDGLGLYVKHQHWKTDAFPDASERGQAVINGQLIDSADIVVAIFWTRFGTPTGAADSGTEEEIRRSIRIKKQVAVYFSDLEPIPAGADSAELSRLNTFRAKMRPKSLCWSFRSRQQFREQFTTHLAKIIYKLRPQPVMKPKNPLSVRQKIVGGTGHTQIGTVETFNQYAAPPKVKVVFERMPNSISPAQQKQIQDWIEKLAEATTNKTRSGAFAEWWKRLYNKFKIPRCDALTTSDFPFVRSWYRQQMAILTQGMKSKVPKQWKDKRIGAIKAAMRAMGRNNEDYYPELAQRLRIKSFQSLTELTQTNLERVYSRVMADQRKGF